jgi:hypothetical protein
MCIYNNILPRQQLARCCPSVADDGAEDNLIGSRGDPES